MFGKKAQSYLGYVFGGFSTIMTVTGLFQYNARWMTIALSASALLAGVSAFFYFRVRSNAAFDDLGDIPPEYWTRKAEPDDIELVAELDQRIYGKDSIDYPGLLDWWSRYQGIVVLLEDSKIIGALGVWPLTPEAYERMVSGRLDESHLNGKCISEESGPGTHAHWYFGDIVLLRQYRRKMENLSLLLLANGLREWFESGDLADELHLCALAFKEAGDLRSSEQWEGAKFLSKFRFTTKVKSPSGYPVYCRTVTKQRLLEEFESRVAARLEATRRRNRQRSLASLSQPPPVVRRWQWLPFTTAAALLIAALVVRQLPSFASSASGGTPGSPDAPQEIARQTDEVLRIGVRDHTHCTLDWWDEQAVAAQQMAKEIGPRHAELIGLIGESTGGVYEIALAHHCEADERKFVHLILRAPEVLLSVIVTEKGRKTFPAQGVAAARIVSGVPLYRAKVKTLEVAGFETDQHLVFVVSNLGREENLNVTSRLAPGVRRFLLKLEG